MRPSIASRLSSTARALVEALCAPAGPGASDQALESIAGSNAPGAPAGLLAGLLALCGSPPGCWSSAALQAPPLAATPRANSKRGSRCPARCPRLGRGECFPPQARGNCSSAFAVCARLTHGSLPAVGQQGRLPSHPPDKGLCTAARGPLP